MSTANAIEAITDAGKFEILATRVLRQVDRDYARVEHLGVNADGKTVKNPVDGFTKVPGTNPSRFVMAAFSTDQADNLERKLTFDHKKSKGKKYKDSDDGDLLKAARLATDIRKHEGDAEFIFTFCTNRQLDSGLMNLGYAAGKTAGIEVRYLARSVIRDHLDTTGEGQWLRKEHLGIAADTLSIPLLREVSAKSIREYSYELFCSDAQIVETATTKRLATIVFQNQPSVNVLIGESGSGKSVACFYILSEILSKEGVALWMPAEVTANAVSLEAAITNTLQSLCPTLGPESGRDAMSLTAKFNIPFLLVVDDVNRTTNPAKEVKKLISWHRRLAAGESGIGSTSKHGRVPNLIIPIWRHYWSLISTSYGHAEAVDSITAQPMSSDEARECLQACSKECLDQPTVFEVVRRLEHDPILIGLWGKLYGDKPSEYRDVKANTLIEAYIETAMGEDTADGKFLTADIRAALEILATKMLETRELYPTWSRVAKWLSGTQLDALRHMSVSGRICRVVRRSEVDRLEFRHDRLLESILAKPLSLCLSEIEGNRDIISDPFFTDSIARTLVTLEARELVSKLREYAPLVLFRAIRHITNPATEFAKAIGDAAAQWLVEAMTRNTIPSEIVFEASKILEATHHPLVIAVTEEVKYDRRLSGARLANGDAVRGKFFVAGQIFFPSGSAPFIENVVSNALRLHRDRLCQELAHDLESGPHTERELHAGLILAGYFGESSLAEPVLNAWKQDTDNLCFVEALWASIRCSTSPETTLAPLLDYWATLSDEKVTHGFSERYKFLITLKFSMRHGVNNRVVEFLAQRANDDDRLRHCITTLLQRIDHPVAATFVATQIARIDRQIEGTTKLNLAAHQYREEWNPLSFRGNRRSVASRNALLMLWEKSDVGSPGTELEFAL